MKKKATFYSALLLVAPVLFLGLVDKSPNQSPETPEQGVISLKAAEYIGATRCRTCHRSEAAGGQYTIWENSAHAKAYQTLGSDKAKAIAAEKGLGNPQEASECLECHVTGYGVDAAQLGEKYSIEEGVSCESCHGPGGDYYKKATMEGITKGEIDPASVGLVNPDEASCRKCHNERSPSFAGFDFEARKAEIAHPIPEERKAEL